jgi:hypothetical protein
MSASIDYDVYCGTADRTLRLAIMPGAGLPAHLKRMDWVLMPKGKSLIHSDADRDVGIRGYFFRSSTADADTITTREPFRAIVPLKRPHTLQCSSVVGVVRSAMFTIGKPGFHVASRRPLEAAGVDENDGGPGVRLRKSGEAKPKKK